MGVGGKCSEKGDQLKVKSAYTQPLRLIDSASDLIVQFHQRETKDRKNPPKRDTKRGAGSD